MKMKKAYKDLTVAFDDETLAAPVVAITLPWTSTPYLTKEEATWLGVTLYQLLTAPTPTQEADTANPPTDQL